MEIIKNIKKIRHNLYRSYYRLKPLEKKKIILWANSFKQYGCSPKYITEYLLLNYPNTFDIVWVFERNAKIPKELKSKVRIVYFFSIEYLKELHTAKFIICNMRTGEAYYWKKRKGQVYIQTWHSSLRLKKIEGDAIQCLDKKYVNDAIDDSKKIDLLISGCQFSTNIFKKSFWYDRKILECGTPRCDILLNDTKHVKRKVYDYYKIPKNKKMILYAPTFRRNKKSDFLGMNFKKLNDFLGDEWVIGARLHPNVLNNVKVENAIAMSDYSDMQELLAATDILITDFSSSMFDMAVANKICILFTPDLEEYLANERELYFDINELPFPITKDMEQLCKCIKDFDELKYKSDLLKFNEKIGSFEQGNASQKICEYIFNKIYD